MAGNTQAILAKLGIDSSAVPAELAEADKFFKQFAREAEKTAGTKAGGDSGSKFMKAFQNRFAGAGLFGMLSTALGLNLDKLAEKLAETFQKAFGGGTQKAFEEAEKLADAVAERQKEAIEARLTVAQKIAKAEAEVAKSVARQAELAKESGGKFDAAQLKESNQLQLTQLENEKKLRELRREDGELSKKYAEERAKSDREKLSKEQQIAALEREIFAIGVAASKTGVTQGEKDAKRLEMLERQKEIDELTKQIAEDKKKAAEEAAKAEEKVTKEKERQAELGEKIAAGERKLRDARGELAEKTAGLGDRSRLTVAELAALPGEQKQAAVDAAREDARRAEAFRFGSSLDDAGISDEQKRLRAQARQVLDLEAEGEKARLGGNRGRAEEIFGQVGQLREALVATGAVKSTEGDRQKELLKEVRRQTEVVEDLVKEVKAAKQAKLKNQ